VFIKKDRVLLEKLKSYFGVGGINSNNLSLNQYCVTSLKDLAIIINHFDNYPLITQKRADF
jgi:hypothetical protein